MIEREGDRLTVHETLDKHEVPDLFRRLQKGDYSGVTIIDLSGLKRLDSAGVAFLDELQAKENVTLEGVAPQIRKTIDTFSSLQVEEIQPRHEPGFFETAGDTLLQWRDSFSKGLYLTSDILWWSVAGVLSRKGQRKGTFTIQSLLIGLNAVPIITLLSFILGLILALQAAVQLRQFGANIYVANLMAVSMVREMGPMMTAIIVAGRSGSSFASEIATMKVTEELDALKMMAINPIRYVVVPKFHAISVCMPLLVTISILVGVFGGLIVAVTYLELSPQSYLTACVEAVTIQDLLISLLKSLFFAWVIVIIGSYYGFNVTGGAEGVGKVTTYSVVSSIFAVIVFDALFSLVYLI